MDRKVEKLQVRISDPLTTLAAVLGQQKAKSLGRVGVPCPRVCLSSAAAEALRERLRRKRRWGEGMEFEAEHVPLGELGGLIANWLCEKGCGHPFAEDLDALFERAAEGGWHNSAIHSPHTLPKKLF